MMASYYLYYGKRICMIFFLFLFFLDEGTDAHTKTKLCSFEKWQWENGQ